MSLDIGGGAMSAFEGADSKRLGYVVLKRDCRNVKRSAELKLVEFEERDGAEHFDARGGRFGVGGKRECIQSVARLLRNRRQRYGH